MSCSTTEDTNHGEGIDLNDNRRYDVLWCILKSNENYIQKKAEDAWFNLVWTNEPLILPSTEKQKHNKDIKKNEEIHKLNQIVQQKDEEINRLNQNMTKVVQEKENKIEQTVKELQEKENKIEQVMKEVQVQMAYNEKLKKKTDRMENQYNEERSLNEEMRKNQNDLKDHIGKKDEEIKEMQDELRDIRFHLAGGKHLQHTLGEESATASISVAYSSNKRSKHDQRKK
ncbi:hypothetical protein I4U23_012839 [Adineta vaga]|nr:hypothetical protein I4U23_012839 [Adineta vaga]